METGYQLYSSRNFGPLEDTLKMLADLGYARVEGFGALFESEASKDALQRGLAETGLKMPTGHFGLEMVENNPEKVVETARALGITHVFVPYLNAPDRPGDAAGWQAFGARLDRAGAPLTDAGLTFGWHNHDFEFTALEDGTMPIDGLFQGGPGLKLEFDVAWCARAGQDPVHWLDKLADRTVAAHVKDIAPEGQKVDEDGWADVGEGTVDWAGLMPRLRDTGCAHFIMEHDNPSDDVRFATRSLAYLNSL